MPFLIADILGLNLGPEEQIREPSITEARNELQSVLNSRGFRQSQRLGKLLRYMCSKAIIEEDQISEYTIAVDVLGKAEDFKESKDAIVRVEVHRLRKKLSEFYEGEGAAHRVRIVIPSGTYVPRFEQTGPAVTPGIRVEKQPASAEAVLRRRAFQWHSTPGRLRAGALCIALLATVSAYAILHRPTQALDTFWAPIFATPGQALLCIGNLAGGRRTPPPPSAPIAEALTLRDFHTALTATVHLDDATTLAMFSGLMQARRKPYRVVSQSETTLADLENGPVVLIGLLNNDWTSRLLGKLRFAAERTAPGKVVIRDRDNPNRADWSVDYSSPLMDVTKDYALVTRVFDSRTEQMIVSAAGISVFGTLAAGEFLTNPDDMRKLEAVAPRDWNRKNLEIVLSTDVIKGRSGHPVIVAAQFW